MTDEPDEAAVELDPDETQEVINWAIGTAAMIVLMKHSPDHDTDEEALERLDGFLNALEIMYLAIPNTIVPLAHEIATDCIEDAEEQESQVEDFMAQVDALEAFANGKHDGLT